MDSTFSAKLALSLSVSLSWMRILLAFKSCYNLTELDMRTCDVQIIYKISLTELFLLLPTTGYKK